MNIDALMIKAGFSKPPNAWRTTDLRGPEYGYYEARPSLIENEHIDVVKFDADGALIYTMRFFDHDSFTQWASDNCSRRETHSKEGKGDASPVAKRKLADLILERLALDLPLDGRIVAIAAEDVGLGHYHNDRFVITK